MAIIIVEDGSIVPNANSYVSVAELEQYTTDRGIILLSDASQSLLKAMDYLETLSYKGRKTERTQPLQWPRKGVVIDGYLVRDDEIPQLLKNAQMQLAVSIDQGVDPLETQEQSVVREKVDVIEVEYSEFSSSSPIIKSFNSSIWRLLSGVNGTGGNVGTVFKG